MCLCMCLCMCMYVCVCVAAECMLHEPIERLGPHLQTGMAQLQARLVWQIVAKSFKSMKDAAPMHLTLWQHA
jgi:hypothetical protein